MHAAPRAVDLIRKTRDGAPLADDEIGFLVAGAATGAVPEAQLAAWLMAVYQRGLTLPELSALTEAMRRSGETFDARDSLPGPRKRTVDKHSTGGVGDKTSLLVAPIAAAAGLLDPMISGRALGHTGGTLDKLETIPGFNTQLLLPRFAEILRSCGACLIGQTPTLVPADRILYGLRDHTGTVESPFLITASIMSKKLAEDLNGLVLDVKTGSGAFLRTGAEARQLAQLMVDTGEAAGTTTVALLTDMSQPLGRFAGNWLEVYECVEILQGRRHKLSADLIHLTNMLSGWMLFLAGHAESSAAGYLLSDRLLASGAAWKAWLGIVAAQGGDIAVFDNPGAFHQPRASVALTAESAGYLSSMDCTEVGWAVQRLGAGRTRPGDPVSAHAGIEVHAKLGHRVQQGAPLVTLYAEDEPLLAQPLDILRATYSLSPERPALPNLVGEVIRR